MRYSSNGDEKKANSNLKKRGISFSEAKSVFDDDMARLIPDPDHSEEEERFIIIGSKLFVENTGCRTLLQKSGQCRSFDFSKKSHKTRRETIQGVSVMREEYDFSKSVKNPYAKRLKKQISIRIETDTIDYFKTLAEETGISYQNLINSYLTECAHEKKKPELKWA